MRNEERLRFCVAQAHTNPSTPGLYLELMKKCLTRYLFGETYRPIHPAGRFSRFIVTGLRRCLAPYNLEIVRPAQFDAQRRAEGRDWPVEAETMVGLQRLDNLEYCITDVLRQGVQGDLIETGVWRGGSTIFMRAVLKAYAVTDRLVWVADSFSGLPKPAATCYPADSGDIHWMWRDLAIPVTTVQQNFRRYGLLDDQVRFLVGWFKDTLPSAPIEQLALLRLDGDMYESTIQALTALYPKVSVGGYVIVDDYNTSSACKAAVEGYRIEHKITEPLQPADWASVFWRREDPAKP